MRIIPTPCCNGLDNSRLWGFKLHHKTLGAADIGRFELCEPIKSIELAMNRLDWILSRGGSTTGRSSVLCRGPFWRLATGSSLPEAVQQIKRQQYQHCRSQARWNKSHRVSLSGGLPRRFGYHFHPDAAPRSGDRFRNGHRKRTYLALASSQSKNQSTIHIRFSEAPSLLWSLPTSDLRVDSGNTEGIPMDINEWICFCQEL